MLDVTNVSQRGVRAIEVENRAVELADACHVARADDGSALDGAGALFGREADDFGEAAPDARAKILYVGVVKLAQRNPLGQVGEDPSAHRDALFDFMLQTNTGVPDSDIAAVGDLRLHPKLKLTGEQQRVWVPGDTDVHTERAECPRISAEGTDAVYAVPDLVVGAALAIAIDDQASLAVNEHEHRRLDDGSEHDRIVQLPV